MVGFVKPFSVGALSLMNGGEGLEEGVCVGGERFGFHESWDGR